MVHRCVRCSGAISSCRKHGAFLAGEFSSEQTRGLDRCRRYDLLVSHRQFAVAARRLRSSQAGIYFLRDDQGRTLVLSADAAPTCSDQTAAGGMDFRRGLYLNAVLGRGVAVAIPSDCNCLVDLVVSLCRLSLRIDCRLDRARRVWVEFAESAPRNAGAHRHAACIRNFSDRPADLAKNPKAGRMETARPSLHLCVAHGRDADQRTDCLCVSASWDRALSMA